MAQPYSDDLRCKFLEAYEAKAGSLSKLAEQFRVSLQWGKKIRAQQKSTGRKERTRQSRYGPVSRMTEAAKENLRGWLQEQPDLTEVELRERLQSSGIRVCQSRVGQVLRQMGLRRKKNAARARTRHPGEPATAPRVPRKSACPSAGTDDFPG
jgi:transposase